MPSRQICNEALAWPSEGFLYAMLNCPDQTFDYKLLDGFFDQFESATCFECHERLAHYVFGRLQQGRKQLSGRQNSKYLKRIGMTLSNVCQGYKPENLPALFLASRVYPDEN